MNLVSCIILAGGRGSRMQGVDKGLVEYQGLPLIAHVIERIAPQVDDIIISANRNADRYADYATRVVADNSPGFHGPLSGIASCLPHCRHPLTLVVACDMPRLPNDLVSYLQQALQQHQIAVISCDHLPQLAMLIRSDMQATLNQALAHGEFKVMHWVKSQDHISCEYPDAAAFTNLNSQHDLIA